MGPLPFKMLEKYKRTDIYRIIKVSPEKQNGIWNTGYVNFNGEWFIFANVNTIGRTGHNYNNHFVGDDLVWYGKTSTKISQNAIQKLINPQGNIYIFVREDSKSPYFVYVGIGRAKEIFDETPVKIIWEFKDKRETHPEITPHEIMDDKKILYEGLIKTVNVNIFERSLLARKKCIDYYGPVCSVCEFDFGKKYGELGQDFIHVHHLVPLYEIRESYRIDPIKDLRPVCPNCHAMLHKNNPPLKIEVLKSLLLY